MATSKKEISNTLQVLANRSGLALSKEEAIEKNQKEYLYLEYNSYYGGYRLVMVQINSGGHNNAFGISGMSKRLKASEIVIQIQGIIAGIEYQKNNEQISVYNYETKM